MVCIYLILKSVLSALGNSKRDILNLRMGSAVITSLDVEPPKVVRLPNCLTRHDDRFSLSKDSYIAVDSGVVQWDRRFVFWEEIGLTN